MLLKFQVANYRSLRDENTLSLYRTKRPKDVAPKDWNPVSTIAGIFGSNASGKSTVYGAIQTMSTAALESYRKWESDASLPIYPFLLALDTFDMPTEFSIEFRAEDGLDYTYGFSCDTSRILTEWLYQYKSSRPTVLFERGLGDDINQIHFGPSFRGSRQELRVALESRPNALTLSVCGQMALPQLMPAYLWLTRSLICYDSMNWSLEHERVMDQLQSDTVYRDAMLDILSKADLGIIDIDVEETEPVPHEPLNAKALGFDTKDLDTTKWVNRRGRNSRTLRLTHSVERGGLAFPLAWESQGTKSFISLVSVCIRALRYGGTVLVDEIDSSLHSVLTAELIAIFKDKAMNPKGAQLIFTTHDVALLSKGTAEHPLLERDQIYFVEKDRQNGSHLIALSEYAPRRDENIERGYLMGRYGGIPNPRFLESAIVALNQTMVS